MIHPTPGKMISKYKELANDPETMEIWITALGKEFGCLAQCDNRTGENGSNEIFVLGYEGIKNIPSDEKTTY